MSVYTRLTEVLNSATEIPFDDSSKIILFSDCHRGDNSWADDFARNQELYFFAMQSYFNEGFTYIELGDGDELYENKHFADIRQAHSHIFWLLQEFYVAGRFHLIHGNHDMERADTKVVGRTLTEYIDERTYEKKPLFPEIKVHEGLVLRYTPTGDRIFLAHGYQGDVMNDNLWKLGRFLSHEFWRPFNEIGILEKASPAVNAKVREALERQIKAWCVEKKQPIIFGHTHRPIFPDEGEAPLFNTGSCVHPRCITGIEIDLGRIMLIKWWFCPDKDGRLCVTREVLAGPRQVTSIF
jgi:predicted phosphodiesterase